VITPWVVMGRGNGQGDHREQSRSTAVWDGGLDGEPQLAHGCDENGVTGGIEVVRQKWWLGGPKLFESRL